MRKVVKRTAALFMAGMLAFSVAGCGGEKESKVETKAETKAEEETKAAEKTTPAAEVPEETKKEAETTALSEAAQEALKYKSDKAPEEWKIAVVVKDSTNTWFTYMEDGVNEFAEKYKLNAFQKGPSSTDAALQIQVVQDLIAQEVDAICVVPIDPASLEPVLQEAMDAGIVVITHEASSQKSTLFDLESVTEKGYGEAIMEVLAEAMSGEGVYTTMCGLLTNVSHNAHLDAGVELAKEKYPGMTLLEACPRVECEDDSETAYEAAKELFKTYPELKGIMCACSPAASGVARAIEELGLKGKVFVAGTGTKTESLVGLENGTISGILRWNPAGAGYAMCSLAYKILSGEEITEGVDLDYTGYNSMVMEDKVLLGDDQVVITPENMDDFEF